MSERKQSEGWMEKVLLAYQKEGKKDDKNENEDDDDEVMTF